MRILLALALHACAPSSKGDTADSADPAALPPPLFGLVEGFYGDPWEHEERLDALAFLPEVGLDAYVYAPKRDPYHRGLWREAYPAEELARFGELAAAAAEQGVTFCWTVAPGLDIVYHDPEERAALLEKVASVADVGVSCLGLLLDDVAASLPEEDTPYYASFGEAHLDLATWLRAELRAAWPDHRLLFCPTEYWGTTPSDYLASIAALPADVDVFWTGQEVVSPSITEPDLASATALLGRPPLIWDNFPVNDWSLERLYLGPVSGRDPGVPGASRGILYNPMGQARASRLALHTGAAWIHAPDTYDPEVAWTEAIAALAGGPGQPALTALAELCRTSPLEPTWEPAALAIAVDAVLAAFSTTAADPTSADADAARQSAADTLSTALAPYRDLTAALDVTVPDAALLDEVRPWSAQVDLLARAGDLVVDLAGSLGGADPAIPWSAWLALEAAVQATQADPDHGTGDRVFPRLLDLETLQDGVLADLAANALPCVATTDVASVDDPAALVDGRLTTGWEPSAPPEPGATVFVTLDPPTAVSRVLLLGTTPLPAATVSGWDGTSEVLLGTLEPTPAGQVSAGGRVLAEVRIRFDGGDEGTVDLREVLVEGGT